MYEKIKSYIGNKKVMWVVIGIVVIIVFCSSCSLLFRENIYDNTDSINDLGEQLNRIEETKSNITDTANRIEEAVGNLQDGIGKAESSIDSATGTSERIDELIDECERIIGAIKEQQSKEN